MNRTLPIGDARGVRKDNYCKSTSQERPRQTDSRLSLGDDGQLAGVIDPGDVPLGDPAVDLAIAFTFLPPDARTVR
jgi:hypothetical protein